MRKIQIKTMMRYHFTHTRMAIKRQRHTHTEKITNVGKFGEIGNFYTAGRQVKQKLWKSVALP